MKKQFLTLVFLTSLSSLFAQVGIGSQDFSVSEALNVESTNKGFLFPRLYMPDPLNNIAPAINPKPYMVAFNNDPEYKNENSFYYTYNKTPNTMAWRGVLDINIINSRLVPIRTFNVRATGGASQRVWTGGAIGYTQYEKPTDHPWVKIPGLEKTIEVNSNLNETTIIVDGMVQDDNNGGSSSANSYAIGLFIDDMLWTVRTYAINASDNSPCAYQMFNLKSNIYNLRKGTHKFSVYAITRSLLAGDATTLSFGAANSNCNGGKAYLNNLMSRGKISIQIQESKEQK